MIPEPLAAAIGRNDAVGVARAVARGFSPVLRADDVDGLLAAAAVLEGTDHVVPMAAAWRIGFALHLTGRLDEAIECYARARRQEGDTPVDEAQLLAARASTHWARAEAVESRELADRALELAEATADDNALASAWVAQALVRALEGDREGNLLCYEKALAAAVRSGDDLTRTRVASNLGSLENEEGRYAAALAHIDQAVAVRETDVPAPLWALVCFNRAEALMGLGRMDEAIAELEQTRAIARAAESPYLGLALLGLGEANRLRGNASQASAAFREAIHQVRATEQSQVLVPALAGLARSALGEDSDEAVRLAEQALDQPAALGHVAPLLAGGWIRLAVGDADVAAELGRDAAQEAGRRRDASGLAEALELQALATPGPQSLDLLHEAASLWATTGNPIGALVNAVLTARNEGDPLEESWARQALRSAGVRDDAIRIAGALQIVSRAAAAPMAIRALGPFAVFLSGVPVPASAWQSRKGRLALKVLVGRRGGVIRREALAELLWPGQADTGPRLSVVLSTLRSVLDPDKLHPSDHFVVADRESVRLNPETVQVDSVMFAKSAVEALRMARAGEPGAIEALEFTAAAYTGDFLEEDATHGWVNEIRDELRLLSAEVRRALVAALCAEEPERAVPWLLGLLSEDRYDEWSHQRMVWTLHGAGRHGEAMRAHRRYEAAMAELEVVARSYVDLVAAPPGGAVAAAPDS